MFKDFRKNLKLKSVFIFFITINLFHKVDSKLDFPFDKEKLSEKALKCCGLNEFLFVRKSNETADTFEYFCQVSPEVLNIQETNKSLEADTYLEVQETVNIPTCQGRLSFRNHPDKWFRKAEDGTVEVGLNFWFWPAWFPINRQSSCTDQGWIDFNSQRGQQYSESFHQNLTEVLLTCNLDGLDTYLTHRKLYGGLYIISFIFVGLTLGIYVSLWEIQNTHGLAQFSFFVALGFFYLTEGIRMILKTNGLNIKPTSFCFVHAVMAQYFFMTLNTTTVILGFDIFWTLWKLDPTAYKVKNWRRINIYILVSWIIPLLAIISGLLANHYLSPDAAKNENGVFEYAHYRCSSPLWKSGFYAQSLLYLLSIVLFILTSVLICQHRRGQVPTSSRARRLLRETISIHGRLFLILGMTWMAVLVEFFFGHKNPLSFYWLILRVLNILMGLFYFTLFGLQPKHVDALRIQYPGVKQIFDRIRGEKQVSDSLIENTSNNLSDTKI